jgi:hypothetical protein
MSTEFFRNYIDIINENSQPQVQLDEGIMDTIKSLAGKAMKALGGDAVADIANKVKQATGGDFTPSKENAMKVAQALGLSKAAQAQPGQSQQQVAEAWGLAGNWQGKLLQLAHLATVGAGAAQAIGGQALTGMQGFGGAGEIVIMAAMIALMLADTFWSTNRGMVGSMGREGNKGTSTTNGPSGRMPGDL